MEDKKEILSDVYEYLFKVNPQMQEIADDIRDGLISDDLPDLIESLTYIKRAIELTKDIHEIGNDEYDFENYLNDIAEGLENKDYSLVADIIEYELIGMMKNWEEVIKEIVAP